MRQWRYERDVTPPRWKLFVETDAPLPDNPYNTEITVILDAPYDHKAKPSIAEYAQFIVTACNAAENLQHER